MNGAIVHHVERTHGLHRDVWTWRCPVCRQRIQAREMHTVGVLRREHTCPMEAA